MAQLILRTLTEQDETAFFQGMKEWNGEDLSWYTFDWKPSVPYLEMLVRLRKNSAGIDIAPQWVPSTMFYGFVDGEIVGRISVRHRLNEKLKVRGGHIGYAVAPRFRGKGYASEMFRQSLPLCKDLGIDQLMITCADDNEASCKLLDKFGCRLAKKVFDPDSSETIRKYYLKLK
jgi:predicted acetyltransferase